MGFIDWLAIMFIYLKLTDQITWPWLAVLVPVIFGSCVALVQWSNKRQLDRDAREALAIANAAREETKFGNG